MTWKRVPLRDVGTWYGGGTPAKARREYWTDGTIPWLSPKDMGAEVIADTQDHITPAAVAQSSVHLVPRDSVALVVRSGILERVLPVALVPFETTLNQDMKAIAPREGIEARWIAWGLRAFEDQLLSETRKRGTTVASIEMPRLQSFELPVPDLAEQRRIIEILEGHLSHLDAASIQLRTAKQRLRAWIDASVDQAVWGTVWPTVVVRDVLREPMRNGRSDRAARANESGTRTLTLTAVTANDFTEANTKITITQVNQARGLWLEPGDIFVQRANTPELVGTAARFEGPRDWAIFPDLLIRVRVDESRLMSTFAIAALRSTRTHRSLRAKAKGLAGSMPKIDQAAVGSTVLPLPPLIVQCQIVSQLDEAQTAVSELDRALAAQERRSAALRRALLAAAFSGRLTGKPSDIDVAEESAAS